MRVKIVISERKDTMQKSVLLSFDRYQRLLTDVAKSSQETTYIEPHSTTEGAVPKEQPIDDKVSLSGSHKGSGIIPPPPGIPVKTKRQAKKIKWLKL